jgi:hypothetical protein
MATSDAQTQLLEGPNEDLRGEFQAVIMYRLFASMVQGPYRQELRNFFAAEIAIWRAWLCGAASSARGWV